MPASTALRKAACAKRVALVVVLEQPGADQRVERTEHLVESELGDQRTDDGRGEGVGEDGARVGDGHRRRTRERQSAGDERVHDLRELEVGVAGIGHLTVAGAQRRDGLRDEQRDATGDVVDARRDTPCTRGIERTPGERQEVGDVGPREGAQVERGGIGPGQVVGQPGDGVPHPDLAVAPRHEDEHRRGGQLAEQVEQEGDRRVIGPVQVVEHDDERLVAGGVAEAEGHAVEETGAAAFGGFRVEPGGALEQLELVVGSDLAEDLRPRPERDPEVLAAAPCDHERGLPVRR